MNEAQWEAAMIIVFSIMLAGLLMAALAYLTKKEYWGPWRKRGKCNKCDYVAPDHHFHSIPAMTSYGVCPYCGTEDTKKVIARWRLKSTFGFFEEALYAQEYGEESLNKAPKGNFHEYKKPSAYWPYVS